MDNHNIRGGHGIGALVDGRRIYVGNSKLMALKNIDMNTSKAALSAEAEGTVCHIADDKNYLGYILIADEIKDDSEKCVKELKKNGVKKIVMLTGDRMSAAKVVADRLGITDFFAELLPGDKVDRISER